jgi:hypothetical protein
VNQASTSVDPVSDNDQQRASTREQVINLATVESWDGPGRLPPGASNDDLTAQQAAASLGCVRPNGTPRDIFYTKVLPTLRRLGGVYRNGGRSAMVTRAALETYKQSGGC